MRGDTADASATPRRRGARRGSSTVAADPSRPTHPGWRAKAFVAVTAALLLPMPGGAQIEAAGSPAVGRVVARLGPEIRRAMVEGNIPSIVVAITDRHDELWSAAYGESNVWAHTPATTRTVYLIGSTFKAQSTVALLQQMEAGRFSLDDPVHDYLGELRIRGEDPSAPVTFRHILTHTSGIPGAFGPHLVWGETVPPALAEYLADSLQVVRKPLEKLEYSNLAFSLVAYLVERVSGVPYKEYVRTRVWSPLGMRSTDFDPTPDMQERMAVPYVLDDSGRPAPAPRLKANVWPAGIVYGTIHDQARWVRFNLGDGTVATLDDTVRILKESTLRQMQTLQYPRFVGEGMAGGWGYEDAGYGLTWWTTHRGEERFFGHSGSVPGYTAFVMGNRTRGFGVVFLTNGNQAHPHLVRLSNLALDLLAEEVGSSR